MIGVSSLGRSLAAGKPVALKILLIDAGAGRAQALEEQLCEAGFAEILRRPGGAGLTAIVERAAPDLIVFDLPAPDRGALEDIRAVAAAHPVVMLAGGGDAAFAEAAIAAGVCSYHPSGAALEGMKPIAAAAIALFRRRRRVEIELAAANALIDERRLIERAKAILIKGRRMTEPEAYRWLQKKAMDQNRKLAEVAATFLEEHEAEVATAAKRW